MLARAVKQLWQTQGLVLSFRLLLKSKEPEVMDRGDGASGGVRMRTGGRGGRGWRDRRQQRRRRGRTTGSR
eukprot:764652-Hanusia_phi.AAC.5